MTRLAEPQSEQVGCHRPRRLTASDSVAAPVRLLSTDRYPRSSRYDAGWLLSLDMGPHPLWQLEDLLRDIDLSPGDTVLDLGAGRGATSVFLAREYGATVVSLDLWIANQERQQILDAAGVSSQVSVIHGDVRTIDLGEDVFDAVVSIDAFEYFGTDVRFLPRLLRAVKPGGLVAMSSVALHEDPYVAGIPSHVGAVVSWEAAAWHPPSWWQRHWELSGMMDDVRARWQHDGRDDWLRWEQARLEHSGEATSPVLTMLEADTAGQIGMALVTGRKRSTPATATDAP